ncbi:thioredoxin-disulfide reductase [Candidatus Micrarchaeota archaeon]|nr:thioredoxin-disulfide reductase [Candidatus Micrarchaeota archaeon]
MSMEEYNTVIIGAGPAGLSAAIYASRAGRKTLLLDKATPGGQIYLSSMVENYPGVKSTSGQELIKTMVAQAESFGTEVKPFSEVIESDLKQKQVKTKDSQYHAENIIIATGNRWRKLGVPGEDDLVGRGVSYCATCDGPFFKGKNVAVVGGGDSAVEETLHLTNFAEKVTLIHRRDELRAEKYMQEKAFENERIEFLWNSEVQSINGESGVESLSLKNNKTGEESRLPVAGVFIYIGMLPNTELFRDQLETDERGYIKTTEKMETALSGVFAAGDARHSPVKQITTATADGTIAAIVSSGGH